MPGRGVARLRRGALPAPLHMTGSLLRYSHLGLFERLQIGRAAFALRELDLADPGRAHRAVLRCSRLAALRFRLEDQ
jgi:hypothetical protein